MTQAIVFMVVGVIGNLVTLLIPIIQPYILQDQLHLDTAIYGRVAGDLALVQSAVMLSFVTVLGAFGDRFGNKLLMFGSMTAMGVGCFLSFHHLAAGCRSAQLHRWARLGVVLCGCRRFGICLSR